jgi:cation diffusion facilitator CzcD-associated flavoprotein CzcO
MSSQPLASANGSSKPSSSEAPDLDAVIVGAGFSGIYMLYRMRDVLGLNVRVFEAGDGVGGTWYWNRYPGARCDSESFYYSFSFSPELDQEWEWTRKYPEQPEILRYLNFVADRFDLKRDIQLSTRVTEATFDEANNSWKVISENGESITARYLISAVGCLSSANVPDFKGLEDFEGEWYHTGSWPHEGVDFSGKRVGLIGTGSTGIQATPVIAAEAEHLTVFQRTPNFSIPARNAPLSAEDWQEIRSNYPETRRILKSSLAGFPYTMTERSAKDVDDDERKEIYEKLWEHGGFKFLWGSFFDIMVDLDANATAADFIRGKIRETIDDPTVADILIPTDHPYGSKRPPIDTGYFETYNRDNVKLVDIRKAPIQEITKKGLKTEDAEFELDVIVFATGFDAMTGSLLRMNITGRDGRTLEDKWSAGPRTFLGLQVEGFPNLFTITGPGSPSVLVNMPVAIEQHVEWIADCIAHMRETGMNRIEANLEAEDEWVQHVNDVASLTLFSHANSWYLGANIPGKARVFMPYPGGLVLYGERCDASVENGYEGFTLQS